MKCTRQGVFETNSSSSHSISLAKESTVKSKLPIIDDEIVIETRDFDWGYESYTDAPSKLAYIIADLFGPVGIHYKVSDILIKEKASFDSWVKSLNDREKAKYEMLLKVLKKVTGISKLRVIIDYGEDDYCYGPLGRIDHQSQGTTDDIFDEGEEALENFIFNPKSELIIDNDNHE